MKQETRNRIGLLLFIFLLLMGGCLIALYVFLGHNWNFAATEIDSVSGNMDEYLVIVYDGTTDTSKLSSASSSSKSAVTTNTNSESAANANTSSDTVDNSSGTTGTLSGTVDESAQAEATAANTATEANGDTQSSAANVENATSGNTNAASNANNASNDISKGLTGVGERFLRYFNLGTGDTVSEEDATGGEDSVLTTEIPEGLHVGDALAIYKRKHAEVLTLYTKNPAHYKEGTVFIKGGYKIGVFGLTSPEPYYDVQKTVDSLKAQGATTIIAIVPNKNYLAAVTDVNMVIVTQGTTSIMKSYPENGALYVESSPIGTIDAIIVSPNHIVSTKTL